MLQPQALKKAPKDKWNSAEERLSPCNEWAETINSHETEAILTHRKTFAGSRQETLPGVLKNRLPVIAALTAEEPENSTSSAPRI